MSFGPKFSRKAISDKNERIVIFIKKNSKDGMCIYTARMLAERFGISSGWASRLAKKSGYILSKTEYITERETDHIMRAW